jgi:hypothetical protein
MGQCFFLVHIKFLGNNGTRMRPATGRRGVWGAEPPTKKGNWWYRLNHSSVFSTGFYDGCESIVFISMFHLGTNIITFLALNKT